jgi:hypothetical protein
MSSDFLMTDPSRELKRRRGRQGSNTTMIDEALGATYDGYLAGGILSLKVP